MSLTRLAVTIGIGAGWAAAKFSASLLYGVRPHDLATFTVVPLFLIAVAFSCLLDTFTPRARVDPGVALRHE